MGRDLDTSETKIEEKPRFYVPGVDIPGGHRFKVVDMLEFQRLSKLELTQKRACKELGLQVHTYQTLLQGKHWQQDREKIEGFNKLRHTDIDPETGVASENVIGEHGTEILKNRWNEKIREEELASRGELIERVADNKFMADGMGELSARMIEVLLQPNVIQNMKPTDIIKYLPQIIEKWNLLMGNSTQIISYEEHLKLDALLPKLIEEAKRRGITIEGEAVEVTEDEDTTEDKK